MIDYFKVGVHKGTSIDKIKDELATEDVERIVGYEGLIKRAHQEAHECNSSAEVHDWIDWFEKELKG